MITILTGPVGGGKTTFLKEVIARLRARGIPLDGYLSERVMEGSAVAGYDLEDLCSGVRSPFLRKSGPPEGIKIGSFVMGPAGLAAAEKIIGRSRPTDFLVVDEIGRLELEGKGVWRAVAPIFTDARRKSLVVIREALLAEFQPLWATGIDISVVELTPANDPGTLGDKIAGEWA